MCIFVIFINFFFVGASSNEKGKANVTDLRVKLYKKNQKMQSSTPPSKSTKKIEDDLDDYVSFCYFFFFFQTKKTFFILFIFFFSLMIEILWKKLICPLKMKSTQQQLNEKLRQIESSRNLYPE